MTPHDAGVTEERDDWYLTPSPLAMFFWPKTIAVIGASDRAGSIGHALLKNLLHHAGQRQIFAVNPQHTELLNQPCYPSIADVPASMDLALIATPAQCVPSLVRECGAAGVKGALIISGGFKEIGAHGLALEQEILTEARQSSMRIIGPNCLGLMRPGIGLNATFGSTLARSGSVALLSQSGAICTATLDWSKRAGVGFSTIVSLGSMLDIGWSDMLDFLGDDPLTRSILIYMETVGDARAFLSAAREVGLRKPIVILKPGRTSGAAQAARSHTGALTGDDQIFDAALRRCGALRVNTMAELFALAEVVAHQPLPRGPRLAILTNAGGLGVIAADALRDGGELAPLAPATRDALERLLPAHWSHGNPVDMLGTADPEHYARACELLIQDPSSDGLLVLSAPQALSDPTKIAEAVVRSTRQRIKPVLACWMGGEEMADGTSLLTSAGIATFPDPEGAVGAFQALWRYTNTLRSLYETPTLVPAEGCKPDRNRVDQVIQSAQDERRTLLSESEAKQLLAAYGLPVVETLIARSPAQAVTLAAQLGYPVALKLHSHTITHKSDVGGVRLGLSNAAMVRRAYAAIERSVCAIAGPESFEGVTVQPMISSAGGFELILGSSIDPQFGPVLLVGLGGQLVEIVQDYALGLPPLTPALALRMLEQTRIFTALSGLRNRKPVDLPGLAALMVRFSQLVIEQPRIKEIEMNPLLVNHTRIIALDARISLHPFDREAASLPRPAIRPYPSEYVEPWTLRDGIPVVIRPIRPEDEPLVGELQLKLSPETIRKRYFQALGRRQLIDHQKLARVCFLDYDREIALVVERKDQAGSPPHLIALAQLRRTPHTDQAEFALLVADDCQGQGLGSELLRRLIAFARQEGIRHLGADLLADNQPMQRLCRRFDFQLKSRFGGEILRAERELWIDP